jgi:cell filamentation protein, protein adenylyltransferase
MDAQNLERLEHSPMGQLVPFVGPDPATHEIVEGRAFLPNRLPADIRLSTATWTAVNAASAALARLDGAARRIPSPDLLRQPTLRREAQSTSALEGTYAPFADVLAADQDEPQTAELREVLNFARTAEMAFDWPPERAITLGMLGELQRTLVAGASGELEDAGGVRDRIVVVGKRGSTLDEARFVPTPPGDQLRGGTERLLRWLASPPNLPAVVQAGMVHYQFETLHPFSDGNGRVGRLLVIVQLVRAQVVREPLLVVSPWFEQRREQYQDALLKLSCTGDWDTWITFFAEGVAASADGSQQKVEALVELQENLRARVQRARKRGRSEQLAADLVGRPYVTVRGVSRTYGLTEPGASNVIRTLVSLGILEPTSLRAKYGAQMYIAREVVDILLA